MHAIASAPELIPIDQLDPHPDHPRLELPKDAIARLVDVLGDEYPAHLTIRVRRTGERFQIVGGVLRTEAARLKKFTHVLARVEELDDGAALLELVADNAHAPLSPLEIALHALKVVQRAKGGRGRKGGISAFAKVLGKSERHVGQLLQAARVFRAVRETPHSSAGFARRVKHLVAVHKAHPSVWPVLVPLIVEKEWSLKETERAVDKVAEVFDQKFDASDNPWWSVFLDPQRVARALATRADFTASKVNDLIARANATRAMLAEFHANGADTAALEAEWREWLKEHAEGESWRPRGLEQRRDQLRNRLEGQVVRVDWLRGDWRDHIDMLPDESVRVVILDPPYGNGNGCLGRAGRHHPIANNATLEDAVAELKAFLLAILRKLRPDAHVLVFCDWKSLEPFKQALVEAGFRVRTPAVWDKGIHGLGDLDVLGEQCELILHATVGKPTLYRRAGNMFGYPRVPSDRHPTEKNQALIEELIGLTTVPGDVVADGFGGVATTAAAAKATGRACWSCELNPGYYTAGERRLEETPTGPAHTAPPVNEPEPGASAEQTGPDAIVTGSES